MSNYRIDWGDGGINWDAVFKCMKEYRQQYPGKLKGHDYEHDHEHYNKWMRENWGVDHVTDFIQVVDEQKYMMLLLRFA